MSTDRNSDSAPSVSTAFHHAIRMLLALQELKKMADRREAALRVGVVFESFRMHLKELDRALEHPRVEACFLRAGIPVEDVDGARGEIRTWHHIAIAIGLHWYQQILKNVEVGTAMLVMHGAAGPSFNELTAERVVAGWRASEICPDGEFEFGAGDPVPWAHVEELLVGMELPDLDRIGMMLHKELACAAALDVEPELVDEPLSAMAQDTMVAMLELGALDSDNRRSTEETAEKALPPPATGNALKAVMVELKRRKLVESKRGRDGGFWLTSKGIRRARKLASE